MGPPDVIVYVANGQVNRPVCIITCANRYCSLVTAENDWAENRAMCVPMILRNFVLKNKQVQFASRQWKRPTACLQAHMPDMKF
jgi:hypothetical protein